MTLIRPRLTDHYGISLTQAEVDFAIPYLDEDIPLFLDPFLLWKSPSLQDQSLHTAMVNSFNHLGVLVHRGDESRAENLLIRLSECNAVGFGASKNRQGKLIGQGTARAILDLFRSIPQIRKSGFVHFEEIQLLIDGVARDRISDIACNFLTSWLIDYTVQECERLDIPVVECQSPVYDYARHQLEQKKVGLPVLTDDSSPILLVPKRWLRRTPWIGYDHYFKAHFPSIDDAVDVAKAGRVAVLMYNRDNYGQVEAYIRGREREQSDCVNDPLFSAIPVSSAKRKMATIRKLPTGKTDNADRQYEDMMCQLMASLVYPHLDFAAEQSRVDSGTQIRDLIFYSNRSQEFLREIYDEYDCRQMVLELKNVKAVGREHINQLNRYLKEQFGRFGVILTRNRPPRTIVQNTIDLWSGQRRCILILDDTDVELMVQLYESKQRLPIEVLKKKYIEFTRACPG